MEKEHRTINCRIIETKPIQVSNSNYRWLREKALEENTTINKLANEIIHEYILEKKREEQGNIYFINNWK